MASKIEEIHALVASSFERAEEESQAPCLVSVEEGSRIRLGLSHSCNCIFPAAFPGSHHFSIALVLATPPGPA